MNVKDVKIAGLEERIDQLLAHLGSAIYRLEEVWEMPEVAGDLTSFYPEWVTERLDIKPVENAEIVKLTKDLKQMSDLYQGTL
jgi:hypothetical protein